MRFSCSYNACECYRSGGTIGMKRYALRSLVGKDMMMSSKDLASIPCDKNSSHQRPRNQKNNVHVPQSPSAKSPQVQYSHYSVYQGLINPSNILY